MQEGNVTATAYDTFGRVSQISVENWAELDYTYSNGNLSAITRTEDDDTAQTYRFTYDSIGRLIACEKKLNGETILRTYQEFNEHNQQTLYGYQMGDAAATYRIHAEKGLVDTIQAEKQR